MQDEEVFKRRFGRLGKIDYRKGLTERKRNISIYSSTKIGLFGIEKIFGMEKMMNGKIQLPEAFEERMRSLLGTEYEAFRLSYEQDRYYGLRYNPLKTTVEEFTDKMPFSLEKISWAEEGFYYDPDGQPGKHVLHEAGAYYIQEPSAMAVVEILDPKPGEKILDLCAAPGGKSTQIAGRMQGQGLLVSNEIIPNRAKILAQNIERMGIKNCVVCNEPPDRMAMFFPAFFDRIVVDAPCSGEGMFRKDDTAVSEWSPDQVRMCAKRQHMILEEAAGMLKPGGRLVYSTCTFAPDENEGAVSRFLKEHTDFSIEQVPCDPSFSGGRPNWTEDPAKGLEHTMRLFPHKLKGEGHYIAVLRKAGTFMQESADNIQQQDQECYVLKKQKDKEAKVRNSARDGKIQNSWGGDNRIRENRTGHNNRNEKKSQGRSGISIEETVVDFLHTELGLDKDWISRQGGSLQMFGEQIYLIPAQMIPLKGLKVVRPGLHLATDKKNRLEPSHALALTLRPQETERRRELTKEEAEQYLHGESLACGTEKGWILLTYAGYPIGFGKASGGQMKNHYPKGLRK